MPSIEDVYAKFGEAAEAAQLLETELGNILLAEAVNQHGFAKVRNKALAKKIIGEIDRKSLGQLISSVRKSVPPPDHLAEELSIALEERNRLNHSFYREHNFRRNSEEGRAVMVADLQVIHDRILRAYVSVMVLSGVDITTDSLTLTPTTYLPLKPQ